MKAKEKTMLQKIRRAMGYLALLLFPLTLNYFSPYVSMDGAMTGVVSGSLLVFGIMFLTGLFFGRAWCAFVCPMAGLGELTMTLNARDPSKRLLNKIRWSIFTLWALSIIAFLILAGGVKGVDPLHLTESVVSVDMPVKFITYYLVLLIFFLLNVTLGKRGACHSICWMSPFLEAGFRFGRLMRIPQLRIRSRSELCVSCGKCDKVCPMSIPVTEDLKLGAIRTADCILCGQCVDCCPKGVLAYGIDRRGHE